LMNSGLGLDPGSPTGKNRADIPALRLLAGRTTGSVFLADRRAPALGER
jgi:hypothetical protein